MFLSNRFQQIQLNGQCFSWSSVPAGVQNSSILGQLLFLYVNDLPDSLQFAAKLFSDDISLFSNVYDPIISAGQLDSDLKKKISLGIQMENDLESWSFETGTRSYIFLIGCYNKSNCQC